MVGLCLLLCSKLVWGGTWRDDFGDGNLDEWSMALVRWPAWVLEHGVGNWHVEDDMLIGGDHNINMVYSIVTGDLSWTDYTVEVSVNFSKALGNSPKWSGVFLYDRVQEQWGAYGIAMQNWGDQAPKQLQVEEGEQAKPPYEVVGGHIVLQANDRHIFPKLLFRTAGDRWYRLKVSIEGDVVRCFIDDKKIIEFPGGGLYDSGRVGLSVNGVVARFDDFMVTGPQVPDGGSAFLVNPQAQLATIWATIKRGK